MAQPQTPIGADFVPLNAEERQRLRASLDGVGTHTLLLSLLELTRGSKDAELIVAALLDRLSPAEGGGARESSVSGAIRP